MSNVIAKTFKTLKRADGSEILDLNADWVSDIIPIADWSSYGIHLGWDNIAVTGVIQLQYTCQPAGVAADVTVWSDKNIITLDGTYVELLFLDSILPITNMRMLFTHTAGAANMESYVTRKK